MSTVALTVAVYTVLFCAASASASTQCSGTLTGTQNSDVYVNGTTCTLQNATVHGWVYVQNGGNLFTSHSTISRGLMLQSSGYVSVGPGSVIYGAVVGFSGTSSLYICGAEIYQFVDLSSWAGNVEIHGTAGYCDGTYISQSITALGSSPSSVGATPSGEFVIRNVDRNMANVYASSFGYVDLTNATFSDNALLTNSGYVRAEHLTVHGSTTVQDIDTLSVSDSSLNTLTCVTYDAHKYVFDNVSVSVAKGLCEGVF